MLYIVKKLMLIVIGIGVIALLTYTYTFDTLFLINNYTVVNITESNSKGFSTEVIKAELPENDFIDRNIDIKRPFINEMKVPTTINPRTTEISINVLTITEITAVNTDKSPTDTVMKPQPKEGIYCYKIKDNSLQDISDVTPEPERSIFFHETSCNSYVKGKIWLNPRQACAIESAAKMNPNLDVYVLFSSPGVRKFEGDESDKILEALLSYNNVKILHLNFEKYANGTPIDELYRSGLIEQNSDFAVAHASDILRYLTLWKYGGIYLDTDVVVLKSLEDLPFNSAGAESEYDISAGMFKFSANGTGHQILDDVLTHLKNTFDPNAWSESSVGVINRVVKNYCGNRQASDLFNKECESFTVYPPKYFYPIFYGLWDLYFSEKHKNTVLNYSEDSYVVHIWNKLSAHKRVQKEKDTAYHYYAKRYCPKVFSEVREVF